MFRILNGLPYLQQVVEVPFQFLGASADASGSDDDTHAFGNFEFRHRVAQLIALFTLDSARDTTGSGVVGHKNHVAAGEAQECRQGGTFVATLFFLDLHQDFLAFFDKFLNGGALACTLFEISFGDFLKWQKAMTF